MIQNEVTFFRTHFTFDYSTHLQLLTVIRIKTFFEVHKEEATWPGIPTAIDRYTRDVMNIRGGREEDEADILKSVVKEMKDAVAPVETYFLCRIFEHLRPDWYLQGPKDG